MTDNEDKALISAMMMADRILLVKLADLGFKSESIEGGINAMASALQAAEEEKKRLRDALKKIETESAKYMYDTGGFARGGLQIVNRVARQALATPSGKGEGNG